MARYVIRYALFELLWNLIMFLICVVIQEEERKQNSLVPPPDINELEKPSTEQLYEMPSTFGTWGFGLIKSALSLYDANILLFIIVIHQTILLVLSLS